MVISVVGGGKTMVRSWEILSPVLTSPPPEIVAVFVTLSGAFSATSTVTVITGKDEFGATESERVQVRLFSVQVHPVPLIAVAVNPVAGSVSTTVTVPVLARFPKLMALMVYVAPVSPWKNEPLITPACCFETIMSGAKIVVGSLAVLFATFTSPPPETVAEFVTNEGAFAATFTVKVIAG